MWTERWPSQQMQSENFGVIVGPRLMHQSAHMGSVLWRKLKLSRDMAACCEGTLQGELIRLTGIFVAVVGTITTKAWGAVCLLLAATQMEHSAGELKVEKRGNMKETAHKKIER